MTEIATEAGLIRGDTLVVTTVHSLQIVEDGTIPVIEHDFPLDLIVTPEELIRTSTSLPRPGGILEGHLDETMREQIPALCNYTQADPRREPS
ncbi:MAG: hypothetical protein WD269_09205 [Acidimicrobiia bacterium]